MRKFLRRPTLLFVALATVGCGGSLDRPTAAELLKSHEFMAEPVTISVTVGEFCDDVASFSSDVDQLLATNRRTSELRTLVAKGLVTIEAKSFSSMDAAFVAGFNMGGGDLGSAFGSGTIPRPCRRITDSPRLLYWRASVTPKGLAAGIPAGGGVLQTYEKKFGEVTGVAMNEDSTATVEFTYTWELTAFGKNLDDQGSGPEPARAEFKKFDDGWRITSVRQLPG
ncbi:MAG: hypothetical protein AB7L71_09785 [Vicinamibacterales bacterium]